MVLLVIFMSTASIMIGNLLQDYLVSKANDSDRFWIWQHYGTAYRSFYTLYELTFAGAWATIGFVDRLRKETGRRVSDQSPTW